MSQCRKAVFLDRDGTINVEKNYLFKIQDFEFLDGAIDALKIIQDKGYRLIIITNQSGIARGYYSMDDFDTLTNWMKEYLLNRGVNIDAVYFCPHCPDGLVKPYNSECNCRKPKLGLFLQAVKDFNLDLSQCIAIGDKIRDCEICKTTDCKGFLIGSNERDDIIAEVKKGFYSNIRYANNLLESAKQLSAEFSDRI